MSERHGFLLVHRTPEGEIKSHPHPLFLVNAALAAQNVLRQAGITGPGDVEFAETLEKQPIGTIWGHPSGYDFRILSADFTEDGGLITPGARLFNYYDQEWGVILPDQFLAQGILAPGGQGFDGWYDFARESDGYVRKFNGQRLSTRQVTG